jgi:hypothetical protein
LLHRLEFKTACFETTASIPQDPMKMPVTNDGIREDVSDGDEWICLPYK